MVSEQEYLADDVAARRDALEPERSFIVQAPAGSGKTELLIQRYLNLLGNVENPEEILAITFTRKAAAEMQVRVLDALRRARDGDSAAEAHHKLTLDLASRALQRSQEKSWDLIGSPRRMRIQTLDAMNASIVRAQPMTSPESAGSTRVVVDADLRNIHKAATIATLDWLSEDGAPSDAVRTVLQHLDNNTWAYVSYLSRMLETRDQWLPFIGSGAMSADEAAQLRERFEGSLRSAVTTHLQRTRTALADKQLPGLPTLCAYAADSLASEGNTVSAVLALRELTDIPEDDPGAIPQWRGIAELLLVKDKPQFRKQVTKAVGFPTTDRDKKAAMTEVLQAVAGDDSLANLLNGVRTLPPLHYGDEQWTVLLALFRLLPLAVSELKRLFAEQGVADHIEIALNAGAALGSADSPGDLTLLLDYQVRHVLVDEMQDTSKAQYRMLEAITGGWEDGDGRSLFCVGDPMQSIYRFRNAEVGQFLLARDNGVGDLKLEPLLLRRNFRSGSRLVDWFNTTFPHVLAAENDPLHGAVRYSAAVPAAHLDGSGELQVYPVFGADLGTEAAVGVCAISNTLAAFPEDDLAVLVRGRTQLPALLANLRNAGIPYSAVDIDRLTDLPEIIDVLALTRAAAHRGDRIAWLGLLRAPWIGLSWTDVHALVVSDTRSTVLELINDENRLAKISADGRQALDNARSALQKLVAGNGARSFRDRLECCWLALGGPGTLQNRWAIDNVYRFFDVIEQHEKGGSVPDVAEIENLLDNQRVSSDVRARVQVMTMHRAKGLQFDHVVLYGLGRKPGGGGGGVLSWFDLPSEQGDEQRIISPVGPRAVVERDPLHRYIAAMDAEKERFEKQRLLYVACTRARKSLHLVGNVAVSADNETYRPALKDSLLNLLWPVVESEFASAFESWVPVDSEDASTTWIEPQRHKLDPPWNLETPKPLSGQSPVDIQQEQAEESVEFYWVGTGARIAGTLVHRWLYLMSNDRVDKATEASQERRLVTLRWLDEMGISSDNGQAIAKRVEDALQGMLGDDTGRWLLSGDGHAELPLTGVVDGELKSVVLDRVRIDDNGKHWVVDYKTSSHEGGNLEGFLNVEAQRYRSQLESYAAIYEAWIGERPQCALYFPMLQRLVKVDT